MSDNVELCERCDRELWSADDEPPLCARCARELPDERWELGDDEAEAEHENDPGVLPWRPLSEVLDEMEDDE